VIEREEQLLSEIRSLSEENSRLAAELRRLRELLNAELRDKRRMTKPENFQ
jgi:regulator of replication initiation timing